MGSCIIVDGVLLSKIGNGVSGLGLLFFYARESMGYLAKLYLMLGIRDFCNYSVML